MAIKFDKKQKPPAIGNKRSYIAIYGDLRDDINALAAWSGKTQQQTGYELLVQAVNEVIAKLPKGWDK